MNIVDYTAPERVIILENSTKTDALTELAQASSSCLYSTEHFLSAILNREDLLSTGVGFETAFPHSKTDSVIDFFVTIGISQEGIDWQSVDNQPVKLIFLIGGLIEEQEKYLKILAALSKITNKQENRQNMLEVKDPAEIYSQFCKSAIIESQAI